MATPTTGHPEHVAPRLYLASRSPRRQALLRQLGIPFALLECDYEEVFEPGTAPRELALELANGKAVAGWRHPARRTDLPVLAADTLLELDGTVLGKPRDRAHALDMLRALAGREHVVHTGVALLGAAHREGLVTSTRVQFTAITEPQLQAYWRTGEPADKAGGYAIQGRGAMFVAELAGSYSSVVGLPLCETVQLLSHFGIDPLDCQTRLED